MKHRLGLHTEREQAKALDLAAKAYEHGVGAHEKGDDPGLEFSIGYLSGIHDLAEIEGVTGLSNDVRSMVERLVRLRYEA